MAYTSVGIEMRFRLVVLNGVGSRACHGFIVYIVLSKSTIFVNGTVSPGMSQLGSKKIMSVSPSSMRLTSHTMTV